MPNDCRHQHGGEQQSHEQKPKGGIQSKQSYAHDSGGSPGPDVFEKVLPQHHQEEKDWSHPTPWAVRLVLNEGRELAMLEPAHSSGDTQTHDETKELLHPLPIVQA